MKINRLVNLLDGRSHTIKSKQNVTTRSLFAVRRKATGTWITNDFELKTSSDFKRAALLTNANEARRLINSKVYFNKARKSEYEVCQIDVAIAA